MEVSIINSKKNRRTDGSGSANNLNSGNGSHPACASCKHQRKKCTVDCVLAPYFPADRNNEFLAVHMVFGVCNTIKLMRTVKQEWRQTVADSLVWEALCRQRDPILGSLGEYRRLQEELEVYKHLINNSNSRLMCGPSPGMLAWKGTNVANGLNNSTGLPNRAGQINNNNNFVTHTQANENGNANTLINPVQYNAPSQYMLGQSIDKTKQDNGTNIVNSVNLQQNFPPQRQRQNLINGYSQQHYVSGQFSSINENTDHTSLCTDVLAPF